MYKLIIFDLDGTLVNSLHDLADACNKALKMYGFPAHETEKYRYFVGDGVYMLVKRALPEGHRDDETLEKVKKAFDDIYGRNYNVLTRPYEGIDHLLAETEKKNILTAVASNKPDEFTRIIVKEMFGDSFSFVSGKKDGFNKKPDPQIALHIMEKLGVSPSETLFVGDSSVDIRTAKNAGCDSVGCTWGFRTEDELRENNATYIAHSPEEILGFI